MFENQLSLFGENVKFINKEEDKSNEKQQAKRKIKSRIRKKSFLQQVIKRIEEVSCS